jgi:hypothetical protein
MGVRKRRSAKNQTSKGQAVPAETIKKNLINALNSIDTMKRNVVRLFLTDLGL